MFASFLITFRESLEAALVVGIVLAFLARSKQTRYNNIVYTAVGAGIIASIFGALLFNRLAGGFEGQAEMVFEGVVMLVGAALLTTMILWMMRQKHIVEEIEKRVSHELTQTHRFGLFLVVFVAVLREGIETVIFLGAVQFAAGGRNLIGALAGIVGAIVLAFVLFVGSMRINVKRFFDVTSILLILFAAGLVAYGVHELQEAGIVPILVEHVWDINPAVNPDGSYPALHEKGAIGSVFKGLFGYNGNPSLVEVASYATYIGLVVLIWLQASRTRSGSKKPDLGGT